MGETKMGTVRGIVISALLLGLARCGGSGEPTGKGGGGSGGNTQVGGTNSGTAGQVSSSAAGGVASDLAGAAGEGGAARGDGGSASLGGGGSESLGGGASLGGGDSASLGGGDSASLGGGGQTSIGEPHPEGNFDCRGNGLGDSCSEPFTRTWSLLVEGDQITLLTNGFDNDELSCVGVWLDSTFQCSAKWSRAGRQCQGTFNLQSGTSGSLAFWLGPGARWGEAACVAVP